MCLGYKVVEKPFPKSIVMVPATTLALQRVKYRIGQTTYREDCGPFAVFKRLKDAARWMSNGYGNTILLVEWDESDEHRLWKRLPPRRVRKQWGRGYYYERQGIDEKRSGFPVGTCFAESVTPLKVALTQGD